MTRRPVVVVDCETTGLDPIRHMAVEVAYVHLGEYGAGAFVPPHTLDGADPKALEINRYHERLAHRDRDDRYAATEAMWAALSGATLAGSNPGFDAAFLRRLFVDAGLAPDPWHHRMLDLASYAAGVLGLDPAELPGLRDVCERLRITHYHPHTAAGDAAVTAQCFVELRRIRKGLTACASS